MLSGNMKKHKQLQRFQCPICRKYFGKKTNLIAHQRVHAGEKTFICQICSCTFTSTYNLKRHLKTHKESENMLNKLPNNIITPIGESCKYCGIEYKQKRTLQLHLRIDHGIDEQPSILNKSKLVPDQIKPIDCVICLLPLSNLNLIKQHFIEAHNDEMEAYTFMIETTCDTCHEIFESAANLARHRIKKHLKYNCDICSQYFGNKRTLKNHILRHANAFRRSRKHECKVNNIFT